MTIKPARLLADILELADLTEDAHGAQRLCWTSKWEEARVWLASKASEAGLTSENDEAGNQWLTLPGISEETIIIGSHLDSVQNGGRFDGPLGVLAGLEIARALAETGKPTKTVRVVSFAEEEGVQFGRSLLGSGAVAGTLSLQETSKLTSLAGEHIETVLNRFGASIHKFGDAKRFLANAKCYLELHIEQGPVLERIDKALAAVTGTYGADRYQVTFIGREDHIAACPMEDRRDALIAAARTILLVRETALNRGGVGSVPRCDILPNATTTIAQRASLIVEHGHENAASMREIGIQVRQEIREIAKQEGLEVEMVDLWRTEPTPFDPHLVELMSQAVAETLGERVQLPSGPSHDAVEIAATGIPTAMLFARSRGGISHSPTEHTDDDDIIKALEALNHVVLGLMQ